MAALQRTVAGLMPCRASLRVQVRVPAGCFERLQSAITVYGSKTGNPGTDVVSLN